MALHVHQHVPGTARVQRIYRGRRAEPRPRRPDDRRHRPRRRRQFPTPRGLIVLRPDADARNSP